MLALVVASRFGMLLGLALWLGLAAALVLALPVIERRLPGQQAPELSGALVARLDPALLGAALLVLVGLLSRVLIDRAAPPTSVAAPVAAMTLVRVLATFLVSPRMRTALVRLRGGKAEPSPADRESFVRLQGARGLLLTLEVCLALYALYAIS